MRLRNLATLFIRLQTIWMGFSAAIEMTMLPGYAFHAQTADSISSLRIQSNYSEELWMLKLRIFINLAGIFVLLKYQHKLAQLFTAGLEEDSDELQDEQFVGEESGNETDKGS